MTLEHLGSTTLNSSEIFTETGELFNDLAQEINETQDNEKPFPNQAETYWDSWKRTNKQYPDGKIPASTIRTINKGTVDERKYMLDIGLTFMLTKTGDSRDGLCAEVKQTEPGGRKFSYLEPGTSKYQSINIPANKLPTNRWIPLPLESTQRKLTSEQFFNYASQAIDEMIAGTNERDKAYSEAVKLLVEKIGKKELMCLMVATAKQESGGAPLGQFVFHRWEAGRNDFSHTIFHIMLEGPGAEARRKLEMTPGQMNHPKNSCKMFLAFAIEKHLGRYKGTIAPSAEKTAKFIYKKYQNTEEWINFYNGGGWKNYNPDYATNLKKYTKEAIHTFENPKSAAKYSEIDAQQNQKKERKTQTKDARKLVLQQELENTLNNNKEKEDKFIKKLSPTEKENLILTAEDLLQGLSPNDLSFLQGDSLQITANENRIYVRIRRENDNDWWGPKTIPRTSNAPKTPPQKTESQENFHTPIKTTEALPLDEYKSSIRSEINSCLRGNMLRRGKIYISIANVSSAEVDRAVKQTIAYLKKVAPNEPFDPEKHDIIITADDTHIWIKIQRESDNSLIGEGSTRVPRDE